MAWDKTAITQLQLPDPQDTDEHPRLLVNDAKAEQNKLLAVQYIS